ncbi:hypothetical protein [Persicitalea jodogahamensis]|uniref:PhoD-like phosphatase metallophosphatase domain-containing protein n=1 Tax=Persicitalea jodogahamensis TaxID=402147 RepID=A0A8J3DBK2_9BACT|nr:hypothetical protein [Persicitalea jodogahamensis]GHB72939.1 hypothetical protein GCM10007390_28790 [Persicitalea jodogahamensis]
MTPDKNTRRQFIKKTSGLALAAYLPSLYASAYDKMNDPFPFGTERGKPLDACATGEWWNWKGDKQMSRFMQERPRDKVIAYAVYTHDRGVLKMTAQLFPLYPNEPEAVTLEMKMNGKWKKIAQEKIVYPGWSAHFRVKKWDDTAEVPYRVSLGKQATFEGTIRPDPINQDEIKIATMSCNSPRDETVEARNEYIENLKHHDPDILFFAGDQSYVHQYHTYGILLFGVQFAEIMKDRPVIMIPDDHDVGQGNFWGAGGGVADSPAGDTGGYYYPPEYVKMVERCQTWHLPDAYDPTPIKQGIGVYYTNLKIGGVDFAIVEDRKFKTGPNGTIPKMGPRPDHIVDPAYDRKAVDVPGLELLGERQIKFLHEWGQNWEGAEMKAVLSQTAFCGAVHLHGTMENRLLADLDCNGWPQTGRNNALRELRRCGATHLCGDQHLSVIVKHGIDTYRDGPMSFTNPALVNTVYGRWWWPLDEKAGGGEPINNALPWTGDYEDGLGNKITMYAYANPKPKNGKELAENRNARADGYGLVRFNKKTREITFECWPRFAAAALGDGEQFPGWPRRFPVTENDGRKVTGYLPTLKFTTENPVVQVVDEASGEILYTERVQGKEYQPRVFGEGTFTVKAGKDRPDKVVGKNVKIGKGTMEVKG